MDAEKAIQFRGILLHHDKKLKLSSSFYYIPYLSKCY